MKSLRNFIKFVEFSTKLASFIPFLVGISYVYYHTSKLNLKNSMIFCLAMLLFDMTTTGLNNHIDKRKSAEIPHFKDGISHSILLFMLASSIVLGLYLVSLTSAVVLVCGILCFGVGILYTFGPAPISRTPYGELFSGTVMGFFIPFLIVYINYPQDRLIILQFDGAALTIVLHLPELVKIAIMTIPIILSISNIMLANNLCDMERDTQIHRYTLPFYLGRKNALALYSCLYIISYITIALMIFGKILPVLAWACFFTAIPLYNNVRQFYVVQKKEETFITAVTNFVFLIFPLAVVYCIAGIFKWRFH